MSEQQDALDDLGVSGVLAAISWAGVSAYKRTMRDYDPESGHDQGWVGYTAHGFLCDRQDRVFSCGRYSVASPDEANSGLDVVAAGLLPGEFESMPKIAPGVVARANWNGSPGWRCGAWRWLQSSFTFGESDAILWGQKRPTKQRAASQAVPDQLMFPTDEDDLQFLRVAEALLAEEEDSDVLTTLVLGHSVQKDLNVQELLLGRSRLNKGGGPAWYWKHDLLASRVEGQGRTLPPAFPAPRPGLDGVPDATVRLRRKSQEGSE
ncbi:hypothetical protein V7793_09570 [Streptomyces sp. KLMMK]|uniref:hypothetical protein n=1 Tax=Streptomyces sp. KLMMK TaxID=3109353 RepID=UPI00300B46D1